MSLDTWENWGIALSYLYNPHAPPPPESLPRGLEAVKKGQALAAKTQRERDYIDAIAAMYLDHDKLDHRTRVQNFLRAEEQVAARYPDDDEARGFWELAQDLDIPVMIHPPHVGFGEERMKEYRLASSVGRPADLCLALSRLIVRGILEDFPRVKIVGSHGGGGICEVIGRLDYAYELQDEAFFLGPYVPMKIKHPPSHYLKKMYFDSVTYHPPAARLVLDTVGG